jgi:hypothetical protein
MESKKKGGEGVAGVCVPLYSTLLLYN